MSGYREDSDVGLKDSGARRSPSCATCRPTTTRAWSDNEGHSPPSRWSPRSRRVCTSLDERDHLFRLAGHHPPGRGASSEHVSPGLLRIFDRLNDTPAEIITELGETLRQTPPGIALTGDATRYSGPARSLGYRWFTDPDTRAMYVADDHEQLSRLFASGLREIVARRGPESRAAHLVDSLNVANEEFRRLWDEHLVGIRPKELKRFQHPQLGSLALNCQTLMDPEQSHLLLVYTAVPGSETYDKLQLLTIIGAQTLDSESPH